MERFISDPDCNGFNGIYAGGGVSLPENQHNLAALADYLRTTGKKFTDLSETELEGFRYHIGEIKEA